MKVDDQPATALIDTAPSSLLPKDSHLPGQWHVEHAQGWFATAVVMMKASNVIPYGHLPAEILEWTLRS